MKKLPVNPRVNKNKVCVKCGGYKTDERLKPQKSQCKDGCLIFHSVEPSEAYLFIRDLPEKTLDFAKKLFLVGNKKCQVKTT